MERPLRLAVDLSEERVEAFFDACIEAAEVALGDVIHDLADGWGPGRTSTSPDSSTLRKRRCGCAGSR